MRIAFVSLMAGSPWSGSEVLWAQTADRALSSGHQVFASVFDWGDCPQAIEKLARNGASIHLRPLHRWLRRSAALSRLMRVFDPLVQFAPDVVCVNQGGTYDIARSGGSAVLRRTLQSLQIPYILLCHCEQPPPPQRNLAAARDAFSRAHRVGVLAEKLKRLSESHLDMKLENASVFHNPVNLRTIERLPWPVQTSPLRLACVGRLQLTKNLESLIDALASGPWADRDWALTVYGAGPLREGLEARVRAAALDSCVTFAGQTSDIAGVWREHHALVMPSRSEGVPLAMVEAMLCGRPVVVTDIGGISEWIEHGRNGFLIRRPEPHEIRDALDELWARRAELEAMGLVAHQRAVQKRDLDSAGTLLHWLENAVTLPCQAQRSYSVTPASTSRADDGATRA